MHRDALDGDAEVLDGERYSRQRQGAVDRFRPLSCCIVEGLCNGVDVAARRLCPGDSGISQFERRQLAVADQGRQANRVVFPQRPLD